MEENAAMARALVKAWFVDFKPVCYVRAEAEKMKRLVAQLREQQTDAAKLNAAIVANLLRIWGMAGNFRRVEL